MAGLSAFLAQNAKKTENVKYKASKRFADENGEAVEWELKAITSNEDDQIRADCMKSIPVPGKRNQFTRELDFPKYSGKLAVMCTVYPNLYDSELQDSYGVKGADTLLKTMLNPGEYTDYMLKVQEINGFNVSFEDEVEEAKN